MPATDPMEPDSPFAAVFASLGGDMWWDKAYEGSFSFALLYSLMSEGVMGSAQKPNILAVHRAASGRMRQTQNRGCGADDDAFRFPLTENGIRGRDKQEGSLRMASSPRVRRHP